MPSRSEDLAAQIRRQYEADFQRGVLLGDVALVQRSLDHWEDPRQHFIDEGKVPAIQQTRSVEVAELLLRAGADATVEHPATGNTFLHYSALQEDCQPISLDDPQPPTGVRRIRLALAQPNLRVDARNKLGLTAAQLAAKQGAPEALDVLLRAAPQLAAPDQRLLHLAAANGRVATVKWLLSTAIPSLEPFTPTVADWEGATPMHVAAAAGHLAVLEAIEAHYASRAPPTADVFQKAACVKDASGRTILHSAAEGVDGNERVMKWIVDRCPQLMAVQDRGGRTVVEASLRAKRPHNALWALQTAKRLDVRDPAARPPSGADVASPTKAVPATTESATSAHELWSAHRKLVGQKSTEKK